MTITIERPLPHWAAARRANFREDYTEMRTWGMSHDAIAARMGIQRDSLLRRCFRVGIYIPEDHERDAYMRLDELIDSGTPFIAGDLPPVGTRTRSHLLRRAKYSGRITAIGTRFDVHTSHMQIVWQSVDASAVPA